MNECHSKGEERRRNKVNTVPSQEKRTSDFLKDVTERKTRNQNVGRDESKARHEENLRLLNEVAEKEHPVEEVEEEEREQKGRKGTNMWLGTKANQGLEKNLRLLNEIAENPGEKVVDEEWVKGQKKKKKLTCGQEGKENKTMKITCGY